MSRPHCSFAEKEYVKLGAEQGIRNDGRGLLDFRHMTVDTGFLPQAHGSSRITLGKGVTSGCDSTDIIATIKAEVMVPTTECPCDGDIEVSVECSSSLFTWEHNQRDAREDASIEISGILRRLLVDSVPLGSLCIMPSRFAWRIFVDVLVLKNNGGVLDAASFAVWSALDSARLPKLTAVEAQAGFDDDFVLDSSAESATRLDTSRIPINLTLACVGAHFLFDPTLHEESCGASQLCVAVNQDGQIAGLRQAGSGALSTLRLRELVPQAATAARRIFVGLKKAAGPVLPQSGTQCGFFA